VELVGGVSSCGILRHIGSVQVVGVFDVAARLCAGDGPIAELVDTARSFLCFDERIQVIFPSSILSDYVHMKARCVFIVSVLLCP